MLRKTLSMLMACYFFSGSILLPLGDFSLLPDLPTMYQHYTTLVPKEECGLVDFIGDYLLGGKEMLGHNKKDKPQNPENRVQFQHEPISVSFFYPKILPTYCIIEESQKRITFYYKYSIPLGFQRKCFRPPFS